MPVTRGPLVFLRNPLMLGMLLQACCLRFDLLNNSNRSALAFCISWTAFESTWLVLMQKQPIAASAGACSSTSAVRRVYERMPRKCASATATGQRVGVGFDLRVAVFPQSLDGRGMDAFEQHRFQCAHRDRSVD